MAEREEPIWLLHNRFQESLESLRRNRFQELTMPGRGPAPTERPAGHGAAKAREAGTEKVNATKAKQPALPKFTVTWCDDEGEFHETQFQWPAQTRAFWKMWADSKLSEKFTANDWSELLDTARLHAAYWNGDLKVAGELRLRTAKFGATPEDRARLGIQFVFEDATKKPAAPAVTSARARRGPLRAVPDRP